MRFGTPQSRKFLRPPTVWLGWGIVFPSCFVFISLLLVFFNTQFEISALAEDQKNGLSPERQLALDRYESAIQLRTALEIKAPRLRTVSEYSRVIDKLRSVYSASPASPKCDDALFAVGELYQMMGADFKDPTNYQKAIKAFEFLIREYPGSPYCPSSAFAIAEIYLTDLKEPKSAEQAFQDFLKEYPSSRRARNARARLEDLRAKLKAPPKKKAAGEEMEASSSITESPAPPPGTKIVEEALDKGTPQPFAPSAAPAVKKGTLQKPEAPAKSSSPVWVKDLRYWEADGYTRVIVTLDGETTFIEDHLNKPKRVVLDIDNATLPSHLVGQGYSPGGTLDRIRLGQPKKEVSRIVLVGDDITDHQVFTLKNPYRIVVDVRQNAGLQKEDGSASVSATKITRKLGTPRADEIQTVSKFDRKPKLAGDDKNTAKTLARKKTEPSLSETRESVPGTLKKPRTSSTEANQDQLPKDFKPVSAEPKPEVVASSTVPRPKSDGTRSLIRTLGLKIGRIVIDPGHGGHDTGTIGPSGLMEKDLVVDIALKLKDLIEDNLGGEVVLTRTDDTFIPLERRTEIANQNQADLFISIHANSSRDRGVRGIETFYLDFTASPDSEEVASRENASSQRTIFELQDLVRKIALKEKIDESREFAQMVQKSILKQVQKSAPRSENRGVKQAPFIVLIGAHMPSILTELSFLSNPSDEKLFKTPAYRQKIAQAMCNGVEDYTKNLGGIKTANRLP